MKGLNNFIEAAKAAQDSHLAQVAVYLILAWTIFVVAMAIIEGVKAFRTTRLRQRFYHPDPDRERAYVDYILQGKHLALLRARAKKEREALLRFQAEQATTHNDGEEVSRAEVLA